MSQMIQALEQRMLMSVTAATLTTDLHAVQSAAAAVPVARSAHDKGINNAITALAADLKVVQSPSNRLANARLIAQLRVSGAVGRLRVAIDQNIFVGIARVESLIGTVHGKALLVHPTSVGLQKAVARDITNLNTNIPARLTTLQNKLTAADAAFDAIANEIKAVNNSQAVTDLIMAGEATLATEAATASAAANQVEVATAKLATVDPRRLIPFQPSVIFRQ
jgi:hypothetical protein